MQAKIYHLVPRRLPAKAAPAEPGFPYSIQSGQDAVTIIIGNDEDGIELGLPADQAEQFANHILQAAVHARRGPRA